MTISNEEKVELLAGRVSHRELLAGEAAWLRNDWLVFTAAARKKIRRWARDTPRPWDPPAPETLERELRLFGDDKTLPIVAGVLAELPPPVTDYAKNHVTWIATGPVVRGWCGAPLDFGDRPWCVVLSEAERTEESIRNLVAHEIAHAWLGAEPPQRSHAVTAYRRRDLLETPPGVARHLDRETARRLRRLRRLRARTERWAVGLAKSWGFDHP